MNIQRTTLVSVCAGVGLLACTTPVETGPPIADPVLAAARLLEGSGADESSFVRFDWAYGDLRGEVEGDGAARFNPPDSLRLDLFTSGDVAMAIALADGRLTSLGQIEDVEVPPKSFLFAMAGLFRPDPGAVPRGFEAEGDTVLVYGEEADRLYFFASRGRLMKVEERRNGRLRRRVELSWAPDSVWPSAAEFRDLEERSRIRWTIRSTRREGPFPSDIFTLPHDG